MELRLRCVNFAVNLNILQMRTSLKLKLNKDRILNCGKYPLVFQIIHRRQKRLIYTDIRLFEESFDGERQRVISSDRQRFKRSELYKINEQLRQTRVQIESMVEYITDRTTSFTVDNITSLYNRRKGNIFLFTFIEHIIEQSRTLEKFGTANNYQSTLRVFEQYLKSDNLKFTDIDQKLIKEFDIFLQKRKLKQNSIAFYINNLRTIYNKAAEDGVFELPQGGSPFDKVCVKRVKTIKRALPVDVVRRIMELDLSSSREMELSRDLFMFSFYSRGMPLVDVLNLRKKDIDYNAFHYFRRKTKTLIKVGLTPQIQQMIDKYNTGGEYIFSFLSSQNSAQENYKKYRNILVWQNNTLKKIAEMVGVSQNLTTYVARHSWATVAKEKGISVAVISEGLGHSSENVTNVYLKSFEQGVLDEANSQVSLL